MTDIQNISGYSERVVTKGNMSNVLSDVYNEQNTKKSDAKCFPITSMNSLKCVSQNSNIKTSVSSLRMENCKVNNPIPEISINKNRKSLAPEFCRIIKHGIKEFSINSSSLKSPRTLYCIKVSPVKSANFMKDKENDLKTKISEQSKPLILCDTSQIDVPLDKEVKNVMHGTLLTDVSEVSKESSVHSLDEKCVDIVKNSLEFAFSESDLNFNDLEDNSKYSKVLISGDDIEVGNTLEIMHENQNIEAKKCEMNDNCVSPKRSTELMSRTRNKRKKRGWTTAKRRFMPLTRVQLPSFISDADSSDISEPIPEDNSQRCSLVSYDHIYTHNSLPPPGSARIRRRKKIVSNKCECPSKGQKEPIIASHCPQELKFPILDQIQEIAMKSFQRFSSLSYKFDVLEFIFKYEGYPTSADMSRLASVLQVNWKIVRDWFVKRREINKKVGVITRNRTLDNCPYCPQYKVQEGQMGSSHVISVEHVQNMIKSITADLEERQSCGPDENQNRTDVDVSETAENEVRSIDSYVRNSEMKEETSSDTLENGDKRELEANAGFKCPHCLKIFCSEWMMMKHALSHRQFSCGECEFTFSNEQVLQMHLKDHLFNSEIADIPIDFVCPECSYLECNCKSKMLEVPEIFSKADEPYLFMKYSNSSPALSRPLDNSHLKVRVEDMVRMIESKSKGQNSPVKSENVNECESESVPEKIISSYTNIVTFNCQLCEAFFFHEDELEEHKISHGSHTEKSKSESFLKPQNPVPFKYICSYCKGGFRRISILKLHMNQYCEQLTELEDEEFEIEKVGNTNCFKIKKSEENKKHPGLLFNCRMCYFTASSCTELENHSRLCQKDCENDYFPSENTELNSTSLDKIHSMYFLCFFCKTPLISLRHVKLHLLKVCLNVPEYIKNDVDVSISRAYKIIKPSSLLELFSAQELYNILNINTFQKIKPNYRRAQCKFCFRKILRSCLALHLSKQCKGIPKELKTFIRNIKDESRVKPICQINAEMSQTEDRPTVDSCVVENTQLNDNCSSHLKINDKHMLYNCNLCDEKFNLRQHFVIHMENFHCQEISTETAYKWLSDAEVVPTAQPEPAEDHQIGSELILGQHSPHQIGSKLILNRNSPHQVDPQLLLGQHSPHQIGSELILNRNYPHQVEPELLLDPHSPNQMGSELFLGQNSQHQIGSELILDQNSCLESVAESMIVSDEQLIYEASDDTRQSPQYDLSDTAMSGLRYSPEFHLSGKVMDVLGESPVVHLRNTAMDGLRDSPEVHLSDTAMDGLGDSPEVHLSDTAMDGLRDSSEVHLSDMATEEVRDDSEVLDCESSLENCVQTVQLQDTDFMSLI